jgi:beta-lactam-binding protein with PASTA domain
MTLQAPGDDGAGTAVPAVTVEAGGEGVLVCSVRNQSGKVDSYDLRVEGLPDGWATVAPATIHLLQFGAPVGGWEADVEVRLHPVRDGRESKTWDAKVVARSQDSGLDVASARLSLTVPPYSELAAELRPKMASGRRSARFAVAVKNTGNAPADVEWIGSDENDRCRFKFERPKAPARPGRETGTRFWVKAGKRLWIGSPVDHRFEVTVRRDGSDADAPSVSGTMRQRPLIPKWAPVVVVAAIALGIVGWKLRPHYVTVPKVVGMQANQAQATLDQAGLKGQLVALKPSRVGTPNSVATELPAAGKSVKHGSTIVLTVRRGFTTVSVPSLCGLTVHDAQEKLARDHLALQPPQGASSTGALIAAKNCQLQPANRPVPLGTPITVYLAEQSTGGSGGGGGATVPAVALSASVAAIATQLQHAGLHPVPTYEINAAPAGKVIGTDPPAHTVSTDKTVRILISAGNPRLAYEAGGLLYTQRALGGTPKKLAQSLTGAIEPTWSGDGRRIAFVDSSEGLEYVGLANRNSPHLVSTTGNVHRPAFAPDPTSTVIAFASFAGSAGQLCFVDTATSASQSCVSTSGLSIDRPAWSPDGKAILALDGRSVVEYTSSSPFSGDQSQWALLSPVQQPQPANSTSYLAWSRNGLAAVVNQGIQMATVSDDRITGWTPLSLPPGTEACTITWRSDARLVVGLVPAGLTPGQDCTTSPGTLEAIDPTSPTTATPLSTTSGGNPASEPVQFPPP